MEQKYFEHINVLSALYGQPVHVLDFQQFVLFYCQPEFMNQKISRNQTSNVLYKVSKQYNEKDDLRKQGKKNHDRWNHFQTSVLIQL